MGRKIVGLFIACISVTRSSIVWSASRTGLSYERCELLDSLERLEKRDKVESKDTAEPREALDWAERFETPNRMDELSLRGVWGVLGSLCHISSTSALPGVPGRGGGFAVCDPSPGFEPC
jgi:hypothetical protein